MKCLWVCSAFFVAMMCAGPSYAWAAHPLPIGGSSESNDKLTPSAIWTLAARCAPSVPPRVLAGIAQTESAWHPYAISINYPVSSARRAGYRGKLVLIHQPKTKLEAIHWAEWYMKHGYTVSVGLVQVNVEMARKLNVPPMALFEPCINLAAGAKILSEDYAAAMRDGAGVMEAFSLYNSGSSSLGIANGYASSVMSNVSR